MTEPERGAMVRVTYTKSAVGYTQRQKDTVRSLGLRRLGDSSVLPDSAPVRGMIAKVSHLVQVEGMADAEVTVESAGAPKRAKRAASAGEDE
jgi:large subunit ribosomal protein L30